MKDKIDTRQKTMCLCVGAVWILKFSVTLCNTFQELSITSFRFVKEGINLKSKCWNQNRLQDNQIIAQKEIISGLLNCVISSKFYRVRRTLNHWFSRTDLAISFHEIHCHWSNSSLHCTPLQISLSQHFSPQSHENMMRPGQLSRKHALSGVNSYLHDAWLRDTFM